MVRGKQKRRGVVTRQPKQLVVIGAEGRNRTEQLYFQNFNRIQRRYVVKFAPENATDPVRIVRSVQKWMERQDDFELGPGKDYAYAVFDTDTDGKKEDEIRTAKALAEQTGIRLLWSNPCFEVWYILHFGYSTAPFSSNGEVLRRLARFLPNYKKNDDVFDRLFEDTAEAVRRAKQLRHYHRENAHIRVMDRNPGSEVDELVEMLMKEIPWN